MSARSNVLITDAQHGRVLEVTREPAEAKRPAAASDSLRAATPYALDRPQNNQRVVMTLVLVRLRLDLATRVMRIRGRCPPPASRTCGYCHGLYGASSMARTPTEIALAEQTRKFKALGF